jgi:hypothetical protein
MNEQNNDLPKKQSTTRKAITRVLTALLLVTTMSAMVFALIQKTATEKAQAELINALKEQVSLREELAKKEQLVTACELHSNKMMNALQRLSEVTEEPQRKK